MAFKIKYSEGDRSEPEGGGDEISRSVDERVGDCSDISFSGFAIL